MKRGWTARREIERMRVRLDELLGVQLLLRTPADVVDVALNEIELRAPIALTEDERRTLAAYARHEAHKELDPRSHVTGEIDDRGYRLLGPTWNTAQEHHDRWRHVADAFHPNPYEEEQGE